MTTRKGDWMQTFTGRQFWPLDPRPEDIDIHDIAHALSLLCRFGGHCADFYSVAEHSVLVSQVVPAEDALQGLLHDATEAYLVDVPRPIKRFLGNYGEIEDRLWTCIAAKFGVNPVLAPSVKYADNSVLLREKEVLLGPSPEPWSIPAEPADVWVVPLTPHAAETRFLTRFHQLTKAVPA